MKKTGIIWKVDEPSKWVNSMALLEKAYVELIICLNLRNLNKEKKKKTLPASNISENHETIEWSKSLYQDRWKQGVLEDTT